MEWHVNCVKMSTISGIATASKRGDWRGRFGLYLLYSV